ncbi:Peptide chain release factor 1, mitochondrial [Xanthoria parietina]
MGTQKSLTRFFKILTPTPNSAPSPPKRLNSHPSPFPDKFSALQFSLIPPDPFTTLPCLLEIRPGAGGSEASLFVADLLRMYQAYCKRHFLNCTLLALDFETATKASSAAINEVILEISTPGA